MRSRPEALSSREVVLGIDEVSVAFHVTVLAADHEQDEILRVARVRDAAGRRRFDMDQPAFSDLARLAADLHERSPAVNEVELVLPSWKWRKPSKPGGITIPLTPNALTPKARRTLRKP